MSTFGPEDIVPYLNQELPGFEPTVLEPENMMGLTLRVRTKLSFGAYADLSQEYIEYPMGRSRLREGVDLLIEQTRQRAIRDLGLQKEIDAEVKRRVDRERRDIEEKAYKRAMDDALQQIARSAGLTPAIESIQFFLNGGKP